LLLLLILSIVISFGPTAYMRIAIAQGQVSRNSWLFFVVIPTLGPLFMLGAVFVARSIPGIFPEFRLAWIGKKKRSVLAGAVVLSVGVLAVRQFLVFVLYGLFHWPVGDPIGPPFGLAFLILLLFRHCVLAPFAEEVFWRGYVQQGLERLLNGPMAVVVQALGFAVLHLKDPVATLVIFLCAVILGIWRWRRQTLVPLIVAHLVWNSTSWLRYWYDYADIQTINATYDYRPELEALARSPIDYSAEENAWPYYVRAFTRMVEAPAGFNKVDLRKWPNDLSPAQLEVLYAWISSNEEAVAEFQLGAQKAYCLRSYTDMSPAEIVGIPLLKKGRTLTSLLQARARMSLIEGHFAEALYDIGTCLQFSEQLGGPRPINELLVGLHVRTQTTHTMLQIAAHARADEARLRALRELCWAGSAQRLYPISFAGERIVMQDYIQGIFTDDGAGDGHIPVHIFTRLMTLPFYSRYDARAWSRLRRRPTVRQTNELFAYLDAVEGCTPFELYQTGQPFYEGMRKIIGDNAFLLANADRFVQAYLQAYASRGMEDGLLVTIAILQYGLRHGHPPDELSQLVEERYLEALSPDPLSGAPLMYKRTENDFLLYSIGAGLDDGSGHPAPSYGEGPAEGGILFWPLEVDIRS
jgi:membrane protease YdiL (CAAX protease family)